MSTKHQEFLNVVGGFFRHRNLLLSIFIGTILLTLLLTLLTKKQYASEMKILVQTTREIGAVSSSKGTTSLAVSGNDTDARMNSQIELLSDSDLMEHLVVFRSKLVPEDGPAPPTGSKQMTRSIGHMLSRFDFESVKKSEVFTVTYTDVSPEAAQQVLRELERVYLEKEVQLSRPAGAFGLFNTEATIYGDRVQKAEQRLVDFQNQNQFVDMEKEKTALDDNLHALEVTTLAEQAQMQSTLSQITTLTGRLRAMEGRITTTITSTPNQQGVQTLIATLTDLQNRRVHLATNYRTNDRLLVELDEQIHETETALTDLRDHNATQTSTDNNPTVLNLRQQVESLLIQHAGVAESYRVHKSQEDDYRKRLTHLQQITPENNELGRQVGQMRGMNQSISDKRDAARVEDLLDAGKFGNVAVAQEPTLSRQHVKPRLSTNLLMGGVTAIFLCGATLFLLETIRSTILTPMDLERLSDAPVLATVPESSGLDGGFSGRRDASGGPGLRSAQPNRVPI